MRTKNSWCILLMRLFSLQVLSIFDKILLAYSWIVSCKRNSPKILVFSVHSWILLAYAQCTVKYFWRFFPYLFNYFSRVLQIRRKIHRNFHVQLTLPDYFKRTIFRKNLRGNLYRPTKNKLHLLFFWGYLSNKFAPLRIRRQRLKTI